MKESYISHDPEIILRLKDAILADFGKLPAEHQATLGLVLINEVRNGAWGTWFTEALSATAAGAQTERSGTEPDSFPTNSVDKEDLLYIRPDLEQQIEALTDTDIAAIADKVGDALTDDYWSALDIILESYVGGPDPDDDEDDGLPETDMNPTIWDTWERDAQKDLDRLPPLTTRPESTAKPQPDSTEPSTQDDVPDTPSTPNSGS